jgi:hypothetical protein
MSNPKPGEYVSVDQTFMVDQHDVDGSLMGSYEYPAGEIARVIQSDGGYSHVQFVRLHASAIYRFPNVNLTRVHEKITREWVPVEE